MDPVLKTSVRILQKLAKGNHKAEEALAAVVAELPNENKILIEWWVEDIETVLENHGYDPEKISLVQKQKVLQTALKKHDAEVGINWDTLWTAVCDAVTEKELEKARIA